MDAVLSIAGCPGDPVRALAFLNVSELKDVVSAAIIGQRSITLCSDAMRYMAYLRIPYCGEDAKL
ncbi:hypothetical protein E2C01_038340 [Portunus trituberculatus]|uniref:Uncharacterized protein n=1 Tax=Portunus trituberculatus TaxID=210409 RepID=A0A5B7FDX9_PORTR|nr:hypothetical protein [Portunus trituberculatus]